jgi:hypothetical protein
MPALLLDGPAKASARRVPPHHADKCICSGAGASTHFGEHPLLENPEIGTEGCPAGIGATDSGAPPGVGAAHVTLWLRPETPPQREQAD